MVSSKISSFLFQTLNWITDSSLKWLESDSKHAYSNKCKPGKYKYAGINIRSECKSLQPVCHQNVNYWYSPDLDAADIVRKACGTAPCAWEYQRRDPRRGIVVYSSAPVHFDATRLWSGARDDVSQIRCAEFDLFSGLPHHNAGCPDNRSLLDLTSYGPQHLLLWATIKKGKCPWTSVARAGSC